MSLVSLIIPVYNVAPYIEQSLRSALAQTYRDMEYILVDDCGTDDSMVIVERIRREHAERNIRILKHNKNRGQSAARNTGMAAAAGDYLFFMDSDDVIPPDCIALHVAAMEKYDVDFTDGGLTVIGGRNPFRELRHVLHAQSSEAILKCYFNGTIHLGPWNKLIRTDFLRRHKIEFTEGIVYEDTEWVFNLSRAARAIVILPLKTYRYIIRRNSTTTSAVSPRHIESKLYLNEVFADYIATCESRELNLAARRFLAESRFKTSTRILLAKTLDSKSKRAYYARLNAPRFRAASRGLYALFTRLPYGLFYLLFYLPRRLFAFAISLK